MAEAPRYALGLDYGTNSVRCLIVRVSDGHEVASAVSAYTRGDLGILLDPRNPDLARQHPRDYLDGTVSATRAAVAEARVAVPEFDPRSIDGIGVDATGSTPIPMGSDHAPVAFQERYAKDLNAMAWLWKDHTATEEAAQLTRRAREEHPEYLAKCGGVYSSEWFWAKLWHCARVAPEVMSAATHWIELSDWIPAVLTGTEASPARNICAAGHKGMYHESWGGYPSESFLGGLHPELARVRSRLGGTSARAIDSVAGSLTRAWAEALGLLEGIPVAVGALDAHSGAVGSGIRPGMLVKILGTSTCDILVAPMDPALPDIPGLCGIVPGSVLPGHYGLEAGQSAVGDLFEWWVRRIAPKGASHESLSEEALQMLPGESGLLALDWNNGNRTVLVDQRLTGLMLGQTLATRPSEIYRALIEATAFGARIIMERLEDYGVGVDQVVTCGGIAEKSPLVMQIYSDVTGRPMRISRSAQTCALGAAIAGAAVAGAHASLPAACAAMTGFKPTEYRPNPAATAVYEELFPLYRALHDAFGLSQVSFDMGAVMKRLLEIRDRVRNL